MAIRNRSGTTNPLHAETVWAQDAYRDYDTQLKSGIDPQVPSPNLIEAGRALRAERYKLLESLGVRIVWPSNKPQFLPIFTNKRKA